jgi:predicted ATPase
LLIRSFSVDQPTSFIGRQAELSDIVGMLDDPNCRLITLVGVGGIGKTRLAQRVMEEVCAHFTDGVTIVLLQPVETRSRFLSATADALGMVLSGGTTPEDQIVGFLQSKELMLLLDNYRAVESCSRFSHQNYT